MRIVAQEMDIKSVIDQRDPTTVQVIVDWSMKFLEKRSHESKSEFYGQNGIEYHQTVFQRTVLVDEKWFLESNCFSTVFNDKTKQDAETSAELLLFNLQEYKKSHPEVTKATLNSDNAGNYKCSSFLQYLAWINTKLDGLQIVCHKFSESQNGKCIADRYGGLQKRHALKSPESGYDILSGEDLAKAITRNGGVANVTTVLGRKRKEESDDHEKQNSSIKAISLLHSFEFVDGGVLAKKHGIIGNGKFFPLEPLEIRKKFNFEIVPVREISKRPLPSFQRKTAYDGPEIKERTLLTPLHVHGEEVAQVDGSLEEINPKPNQDDIFACPEDFCSAFFKTHNGLQKHVGNGKHFIIKKDKTSSVDTIKKIWIDTFGVSKS